MREKKERFLAPLGMTKGLGIFSATCVECPEILCGIDRVEAE
jgi:hypothetical protein